MIMVLMLSDSLCQGSSGVGSALLTAGVGRNDGGVGVAAD
jgi:hypothetical protein